MDPPRGSPRGGVPLIVTDAINETAHAFYRHHDFIPVPGTHRLYLKISTAQAALNRNSEIVRPGETSNITVN